MIFLSLTLVFFTLPIPLVFRVIFHLFLLKVNLDVYFTSVADPGSGAFLTPVSGIRDGWKACLLK
jgi:hypothetical protein